MSIPFSDTTNLSGVLQRIERELGFDVGYITDNATRLKEWTSEVNLTHDEVLALIFKVGGTWQFDDSNHTDDYPTITANLVASQRSYSFTTDETGNLVLDIHRVMVADATGVFRDLDPMDQQTPKSETSGFVDGTNLTGTPTKYDKTANGIFLDLIPSYSLAGGLKVFINREGSYFVTTDAAKKPGIAGLFHEVYVTGPSLRYARRKGLDIESSLEKRHIAFVGSEPLGIRGSIEQFYGRRERDVPKRMVARVENTR